MAHPGLLALLSLELVDPDPVFEKPGLGAVSNVMVIGGSLDLFLQWVPVPAPPGPRVVMLSLGILINGIASAADIGRRT